MVEVPAGSFPWVSLKAIGMADAMNTYAMTWLWTPFFSTHSK
jgi:hypothetical protein